MVAGESGSKASFPGHISLFVLSSYLWSKIQSYMNGCDALWMAKWVAVHRHGDFTSCGYLAAFDAHVESLAYVFYGNR